MKFLYEKRVDICPLFLSFLTYLRPIPVTSKNLRTNFNNFWNRIKGNPGIDDAAASLTQSGGQKIRLGLARALLRDKNILLVDEIAASLDDRNRELVYQILNSQDMTRIEVAHRFKNDEYDHIFKISQHQLLEE